MNIIKIFLKIKDRLVEYRRNYYITHKEYFPGCSTRFQFSFNNLKTIEFTYWVLQRKFIFSL